VKREMEMGLCEMQIFLDWLSNLRVISGFRREGDENSGHPLIF
jgi:hypothetical protein